MFSQPQFRRALSGYEFEFPRDHGSHPEFKTEWWYFTGNLIAQNGREFGYELTFFRTGLIPPGSPITRESPLIADQLHLAHFAISDIAGKEHESWERLGREGLGQAEASTERLFARNGDWTIEMNGDETLRLRSAAGESGLELTMRPLKPFVIHGKNGVHQKSGEPGQASHYISYTRLETEGTIRWRGEQFGVSGLSWMDHEFGSSQLGEEETGWDWFALQMEDSRELMVYQIRREDGTFNPYSMGTMVDPGGAKVLLPHEDYEIRATGIWTSPDTGAEYPMGWEIIVPRFNAELTVTPTFEDQEMLTTRYTGAVYWEGAVRFQGEWSGEPVSGKGYVELVGYAEAFSLLR